MFLYHFTSCESLLKILLSNELRFSKSKTLDDPFERKRHRNYSDSRPQIPEDAPAAKSLGHFDSRVDLTNVLCFFDCVNEKGETIEPLTDLRMWSQYGKSHMGCCIVVNKEKAIERFLNGTESSIHDFGRVEYGNLKNYDPVFMSAFDQAGYKDTVFKRLFHRLFFTKAFYYSGENEYRFAVNNDNRGFAFKVLPILEKIVIAENSEETNQNSVVSLCRVLNLEVGKMIVSNDSLEYWKIPDSPRL